MCGQAFPRFHAIAGFQHASIFPPYKNNIDQDKFKIMQAFNPPTKAVIPLKLAIAITPSSTPRHDKANLKKH